MNKQRERLVELFEQLEDPSSTCPHMGRNKSCEGCKYLKGDGCDLTGRFVDYLLANGVIVPPCKVGQDIYTIQCDEVTKHFVIEVARHNNGKTYCKYVPYDKKTFMSSMQHYMHRSRRTGKRQKLQTKRILKGWKKVLICFVRLSGIF